MRWIEITDELCKKAETLAAQGLTVEQMASVLGIGQSTFYEKQAKYPEFLEAIEDGRAKGIATITNALFSKARKGDFPSMKYYLNNRDRENWNDAKPEQSSSDSANDKLIAALTAFALAMKDN